jgi:glutaredoxin
MSKKTVKQRLVDAFNRADELGGDARDWLQAKYAESPRAQALVGKLRRKKHHEPILRERPRTEVKVRAPAEKAPKDKVQKVAKKPKAAEAPRGLGDPEIKAQVFGKKSCPWTGRAIKLLEDRKVDYDFIDLDDAKAGTDTALVAETRQNTHPWIYLRGQFVGGYNALSEIDRLGQLEYALMTDAEKAAAPPHVTKVVIVPRPNTDEVAPAEAAEG